MSEDTLASATAISLPAPAIVLLPASDLAAILQAVRRLGDELQALESDLKRFKVFTKTGEVDELKERLEALENMIEKEPTSAQADRVEILRALLAAHGGKMPAKLARQKMRLSESTFSRLLATMDKWIEVRLLSTNKRAHLLVLRSKIT